MRFPRDGFRIRISSRGRNSYTILGNCIRIGNPQKTLTFINKIHLQIRMRNSSPGNEFRIRIWRRILLMKQRYFHSFQFVYAFSNPYTNFVRWGRNSYTNFVSRGDGPRYQFLDILGGPTVEMAEFDRFSYRIGRNVIRDGRPPNPLNSICFPIEVDEIR